MYEILIDTGGTFTDGVLVDADGRVSVGKSETSPTDPAGAILRCIANLAAERGLGTADLLASTTTVLIGTTLATNCILEEKGARCCLIHTEGFRDTFELGRTIPKVDIYNLKVLPPKVLIPRYLRFGVEERVQFDGQVITPLREDDVIEAVRKAKEHGVEVPIVCFLHSYINPAHEERAAEIIRAEYPNVVVSSRIVRRWIEYDRLSTATLAAYVQPMLSRFVNTLDAELKRASFGGTPPTRAAPAAADASAPLLPSAHCCAAARAAASVPATIWRLTAIERPRSTTSTSMPTSASRQTATIITTAPASSRCSRLTRIGTSPRSSCSRSRPSRRGCRSGAVATTRH